MQTDRRPYIDDVELFHWNPLKPVFTSRGLSRLPIKRRPNNFGDLLGPMIIAAILKKQLEWRNTENGSKLLSVGSVLHFAKDGDTIWGSGRNGKTAEDRHSFSRLDVRAVRGPKTQAFLHSKGIDVPDVFGDPALLIPSLDREEFVKPTSGAKTLVVPNLNDPKSSSRDPNVLNPRSDVRECIGRIVDSEFVVSSSLHGVVIADAFGIPNRLVKAAHEDSFKYDDYYLGTGRKPPVPANSFSDAVADGLSKANPPLEWDGAKLLTDSMPRDLWSTRTSA